MFGLSALQQAMHPHTTLEKIIFLVENVRYAHAPTATIAFTGLAVLVVLRAAKRAFKGTWWIYRLPEVLVVVISATGPCAPAVCGREADSPRAVLSRSFRWDQDGVDILGAVPIQTGGSLLRFPLSRFNAPFLRTSTAMCASLRLRPLLR
jgi:hypothetical protein